MTKKPLEASLSLITATVFWGLSFVVMKALVAAQLKLAPGTSTWGLSSLSLAIRFAVSAGLLFLIKPRQLTTITKLEWKQGLGLGLFGGVGLVLQMDGVNYTDASTAAFLTQCYCIILPIYAAFRTRQRPGWVILSATLMVLLGIGILSRVTPQNLKLGRGELETIGASILFTGQILWLERPMFHSTRSHWVTFIMFMLTFLMMAPLLFFSFPSVNSLMRTLQDFHVLVLLGILTLFSTLVAYGLMNYWQPHVSATHAGLIYCMEPLFASGFSLVLPAIISSVMMIQYPNEKITSHLLAGGGLIIGANLIIIVQSTIASGKKS
ncbi:MAG: hypothetical protein JWM04_557 [Verrucomicrobiales bacterium]|jgi:drug/metabolite transporter (DMT)-like permease|nr:hypothetical protein [Verrucomicrobiales bacterium]